MLKKCLIALGLVAAGVAYASATPCALCQRSPQFPVAHAVVKTGVVAAKVTVQTGATGARVVAKTGAVAVKTTAKVVHGVLNGAAQAVASTVERVDHWRCQRCPRPTAVAVRYVIRRTTCVPVAKAYVKVRDGLRCRRARRCCCTVLCAESMENATPPAPTTERVEPVKVESPAVTPQPQAEALRFDVLDHFGDVTTSGVARR